MIFDDDYKSTCFGHVDLGPPQSSVEVVEGVVVEGEVVEVEGVGFTLPRAAPHQTGRSQMCRLHPVR